MIGKLVSKVIVFSKKYKLLLVVCIFLCLKSSSLASNFLSIAVSNHDMQFIKKNVHLGDLILRQGTATESAIIQRMSGSHFSHIGVITQIKPTVIITHATTDDDLEHLNQVIESDISEFVHPSLAKHWAIYRLNLTQEEILNLLQVSNQLGEPFHIATKHEKGLYCTTLISDHLPLNVSNQLTWQYIDIPGLQGELLFPIAFTQLDGIKLIFSKKN